MGFSTFQRQRNATIRILLSQSALQPQPQFISGRIFPQHYPHFHQAEINILFRSGFPVSQAKRGRNLILIFFQNKS